MVKVRLYILKKEFLFGDKKNSENLFIERWYQLLKENGRVAAVLPESVFDIGENEITLSSNVLKLEITPNWRYL